MPDKYGDVIIPMTIIRRLECALEPTKKAVVEQFEKNPTYPEKAMYRLSGFQFYNTSHYTLKELCNEPDYIEENVSKERIIEKLQRRFDLSEEQAVEKYEKYSG